jgi:hypothetical protein|eukprot:COSAG02_NODE_2763_length_8071_cov_26.991846_9_plen_82_part_00
MGSQELRPLPRMLSFGRCGPLGQSCCARRHGLASVEQLASQSPCITSPPTPENICFTLFGQPSTASLADPRHAASDPSQSS